MTFSLPPENLQENRNSGIWSFTGPDGPGSASKTTGRTGFSNSKLEKKPGQPEINFTGFLHTLLLMFLLECDLIYGHHDGGFFGFSKDIAEQNKPEHWEFRLFRHLMISRPNGPNGMLATYRFQMMDPTGFGAMSYDQPKK